MGGLGGGKGGEGSMELGGDGVREGHVEQEVCGGGCMDLGKGVCREEGFLEGG